MDANWIWIIAMSLALVPWALIFAKKRWDGIFGQSDNFSRFDKLLHDLDSSNLAYFNSLDLMLQNLTSMRSRAERAGAKFWELLAQPSVEKVSPYEVAAQLVSLGQRPDKVAAMLDLPVSQVKFLQESQRHATRERKSAHPKAAKKSVAPISADRNEGRKMNPVKRAPKTALQNSVIGNNGNDSLASESKPPAPHIPNEIRATGLANGARRKLIL
jgi:hypothetical protein